MSSFSDDFVRADNSTSMGATTVGSVSWVPFSIGAATPYEYGIVSNSPVIIHDYGGSSAYGVAADAGSPTVTATLTVASGGDSAHSTFVGLGVRVNMVTFDGIWLSTNSQTSPSTDLSLLRISGHGTVFDDIGDATFLSPGYGTITLSAIGSTIRCTCSWDSSISITASDSSGFTGVGFIPPDSLPTSLQGDPRITGFSVAASTPPVVGGSTGPKFGFLPI